MRNATEKGAELVDFSRHRFLGSNRHFGGAGADSVDEMVWRKNLRVIQKYMDCCCNEAESAKGTHRPQADLRLAERRFLAGSSGVATLHTAVALTFEQFQQ